MTWKIEFLPPTMKQLKKLDVQVQKRILGFIHNRLLPSKYPRMYGKQLTGRWSKYWSYRVGDYRIIADIQDHRLVIVAVSIDHRRQVYDD